ncbi:MAG: tetratricopeptide repeat protein [Methanomicrobiales archaeon]
MPAVSASMLELSSFTPITAVNFPNILQEKPKSQYTAADWVNEGKAASKAGNYEVAIQCFNKAEEIDSPLAMLSVDPHSSDPANMEQGKKRDLAIEELPNIESEKLLVYTSWPGHDAEIKETEKKYQDWQRWKEIVERNRDKSLDVPIPFWIPVFAVVLILLLRRSR